jgi:hypothetical protein
MNYSIREGLLEERPALHSAAHACPCVCDDVFRFVMSAALLNQAMTGGSIFVGSGTSLNTGVSSTYAMSTSTYQGQVQGFYIKHTSRHGKKWTRR